jgi:hypothetical protein
MQSQILRGILPPIRWSAVFVGVAFALAAHVSLGLFGAALGFAAQGNDSRVLGVLAGLWALMSAFAATLLGALTATRIAAAADDRTAWLHGVTVWCVALVTGALFLSGTLAGSAMGASYIWNGGLVANDAALDNGPGAAIDSAAREAAVASLLGGIAALAGLAGAVAGATLGRRAVSRTAATTGAPIRATSTGQDRSSDAARTPGMMPPPPIERRREDAIETIWSDPAFDRRQGVKPDRRRH